MPLRQFITDLETNQLLKRITAPVNADQELAAIVDRLCRTDESSPALFFEQVEGSPFPVVCNLFGSAARTALGLNIPSLDNLGQRLDDRLASMTGNNASEYLSQMLSDGHLSPVPISTAPCRAVAASVDLSLLPGLKFWPLETVPSLTLPLIFTTDPDTGRQNCGMYRVQVHGPDYVTINFGTGSGGMQHLQAWEREQEPMPVSIALGSDPALIWAAGAPLPQECDELRLAAWVSGRRQKVTSSRCQRLQIPADAEIVIEGCIHPGETRAEGPFGNHTGGYVSNPAAPLMQVTSISHRKNAICPATLVGPPPMEDCWLAKASEQLILALLKPDWPILDIHMPLETIFHGCALLTVARSHSGEGIDLLQALQQQGPLQHSRLLVLLDADIDIRNPSESFWRTINQLKPDRILLTDGRIAIDATGVDPAGLVGHDQKTLDRVTQRWNEYGLK